MRNQRKSSSSGRNTPRRASETPQQPPELDPQLPRAVAEGVVTAGAVVQRICQRLEALWPEDTGVDRREWVPRGASTLRQELRDLLSLPAEERLAFLKAHDSPAYHSPRLIGPLIERARRALPADPDESKHWARLALEIGRRGSSPAHRQREAQAYAYIANAHRARSALAGAKFRMRKVREVLAETKAVRGVVVGEVLEIHGAIARDHMEFTKAQELISKGLVMLHGAQGAEQALARASVSLGTVVMLQPRFSDRFRWHRVAHKLSATISALQRRILFNLAITWCQAGEPDTAAILLARRGNRQGENLVRRCRYRWVEGLIAAERGELEAANLAFDEAFAGFVAKGATYDAARVALDQARYLRAAGQWVALETRLENLLPLVDSLRELHAEAARALTLYCEAVQQRNLTELLADRLIQYFCSARHLAHHRFVP